MSHKSTIFRAGVKLGNFPYLSVPLVGSSQCYYDEQLFPSQKRMAYYLLNAAL